MCVLQAKDVEEFTIGTDDPRTALHGQKGLRCAIESLGPHLKH